MSSAASPLIDQDNPLARVRPGLMPVNAQPGGTPTEAPTLARAGSSMPVPPSTPGAPAAGASSPARTSAQPSAAQGELTRLQTTGPGYSQVKNPFLRGLATVGSVAAGFFPKVAPLIPGTEAHHGMELARAGNAVRQEQAGQKNAAEVQREQAQTTEQTALAGEHNQQTENLKNPQGKTKDEEFFKAGDGSYIGYRDAKGNIYGPGDKDLPAGVRAVLEAGKPKPTKAANEFEAWREIPGNEHKDPLEFIKSKADIEAAAKPKEPKTASPEQQFLDEYKTQHPGSSIADAEKAFKQLVPKEPVDRGQNFVDPVTHKMVRVEPGGQVPEGALTPAGMGTANAGAAKGTESAAQAVKYGRDYLTSGQFTGPKDEALLEAFFEVAKPSSGFRMSQPQIDMLMKGRSWMDSAEGIAYHAKNGVWFPPDQRKQIVEAMEARAVSKGAKVGENSPAPARPKGVPDNAAWDARSQRWKAP